MTTPREIYDEKIRVIDEKIKKLDDANKKDLSAIPLLQKEYNSAIDELDIEKADEIHAKMDRLKRAAELRSAQIKAFNGPEHSLRKTAKDEYMEDLESEAESIKDEARPLYEEIKAARDAYLNVVVKVLPVEERFYENARELYRTKFPGQAMLYMPHGLPGYLADAFVQHHDILDKDKEVRANYFAEKFQKAGVTYR